MLDIEIRRGNRLLIRADYPDNNFAKLRGLMFSKPLKDKGLLLECLSESKIDSAIHMFFVFFPIDVVWISNKKEVVDIKTALPFQPIAIPRRAAKFVLELPVGYGKNFRIGDKLNF